MAKEAEQSKPLMEWSTENCLISVPIDELELNFSLQHDTIIKSILDYMTIIRPKPVNVILHSQS